MRLECILTMALAMNAAAQLAQPSSNMPTILTNRQRVAELENQITNGEKAFVIPSGDGVFLAGIGQVNFNRDFVLIKFDHAGKTLSYAGQCPAATNQNAHSHTLANIHANSDGTIVLIGRCDSSPNQFRASYYSADGAPLATKFFGRGMISGDAFMASDSSGNITVAATIPARDSFSDIFTARFDSKGALVWKASFDGKAKEFDGVTSLTIDSKGNAIVGGFAGGGAESTFGFGGDSGKDFLVLKYSPAGKKLWQKVINGGDRAQDHLYAVTVDPADSIYFTGFTQGIDFSRDVLGKLSSSGSLEWRQKSRPFESPYHPTMLRIMPSGDIVHVAAIAKGREFSVNRFSAAGRVMSIPIHARRQESFINAMGVDKVENIYVCGTELTERYTSDLFVMKCDGRGNKVWDARFDGQYDCYNPHKGSPKQTARLARASSVEAAADGSVFVASYADNSLPLLVKFDAKGKQLWAYGYLAFHEAEKSRDAAAR